MVRVLLWLCLVGLNTAWASSAPIASVKLSSEKLWQRQQLVVTVEVPTVDPFAKLRVDDFKQKGMVIVALPNDKVERKGEDGQSLFILRARWVVFSFVAGQQVLNLPRIRYHPNRGSLKTLAIVKPKIYVDKLPVYVPPTMPVGKIRLSGQWDEGVIATTERLIQWQVTVVGESVVKQTVPVIARQLKPNTSIGYLPVQDKINRRIDEYGVSYERVNTIPLKVQRSGLLDLPEISIQYFDPIAGQLKTARLIRPWGVALSVGLQWGLSILGSLLLIAVLYVGGGRLRVLWWHSLQHRAALRLLREATSYQQLREGFGALAALNGWQGNLTLSDYLQFYESRYGVDRQLKVRVDGLLLQVFSGNKNNNNFL